MLNTNKFCKPEIWDKIKMSSIYSVSILCPGLFCILYINYPLFTHKKIETQRGDVIYGPTTNKWQNWD